MYLLVKFCVSKFCYLMCIVIIRECEQEIKLLRKKTDVY